MKSVEKLRAWGQEHVSLGRGKLGQLFEIAEEIECEVSDGYARLLVDADGVPIRPDDHVSDGVTEWVVTSIEYTSCGHVLRGYNASGSRTTHVIDQPRKLRHVVASTVADALMRYRKRAVDLHADYLTGAIGSYSEYKAKLVELDAELAERLKLKEDE